MSAPFWQHAIAMACVAVALGWLLRKQLFRGSRGSADEGVSGPCSHCPARKGGPIEQTVQLRKRQAPRGPA
ncbi:MAG TPA: hypothetical protein VJX91_06235 [Candidatus Eisenbacteria bacterium]|nr:hypothetical protein [Candidatus Eisenbacteria bacterium]